MPTDEGYSSEEDYEYLDENRIKGYVKFNISLRCWTETISANTKRAARTPTTMRRTPSSSVPWDSKWSKMIFPNQNT
ncbi:hypothetical protein EIH07_00345 [Chryseobacterium taklimakanense]|uniref:hypothetical protein n=1 Tax=Chryseobacterium taklimakanense TaxID=536441 RepID=UPI000F5F7C07|nr:hypothetical protein [Chryseobacterium taklimakanense]AZI21596.1 hypothetical protein EIH07_00345 [Chryseobacterium taklimakanense]